VREREKERYLSHSLQHVLSLEKAHEDEGQRLFGVLVHRTVHIAEWPEHLELLAKALLGGVEEIVDSQRVHVIDILKRLVFGDARLEISDKRERECE